MTMTQIGGSDAATELASLGPWPSPAPAITVDEYASRIAKARTLAAQEGVDALLIGAGQSFNYFAGLGWGETERLVAMLLPLDGEPIFICPRFELGSLEAELAISGDIRLWEEDENPIALLADACAQRKVRSLAIDPAMSFGFVHRIRNAMDDLRIESAAPIIDGCRRAKSPAELALMQQAKNMTLEVQRRAARILRPGIRASAVTRFIEDAHRALGASGNSFCIVLFGEATAYPHGLPGDPELREGDMVLIDTGCRIRGYNSDITRSYVYGEPTAEQARIWSLEQEAQQAAFDAVRPGRACQDIDDAARAVLERGGLGPDYRLPGLPHRTGHGIGLSIHEAPYLVRGDKTPLEPGMCFSNEPMIVVPGRFGVRLEDHFHVTETGAQWFTPPSPAIDRPFA
ncbi:putative M24B family peptidase [Sphingobium sp. SYK-6]|uniref:M24 family metallopeptidase n=1 Tax=Sphingobium sp. (strain NBRC 103272 / SYK-6) TaxID=627192 RepID=UPI00022772B5|nr:putative M24B family peptidase [Sphingobium sp. SYK-6]